jgi:hypothetical protein
VQQIQETMYDDLANTTALVSLFIAAFLLGMGQVMTQFASKQYILTCSFKEEKGRSFLRRSENFYNFVGMVCMAGSGCWFWFMWTDY